MHGIYSCLLSHFSSKLYLPCFILRVLHHLLGGLGYTVEIIMEERTLWTVPSPHREKFLCSGRIHMAAGYYQKLFSLFHTVFLYKIVRLDILLIPILLNLWAS